MILGVLGMEVSKPNKFNDAAMSYLIEDKVDELVLICRQIPDAETQCGDEGDCGGWSLGTPIRRFAGQWVL